MTGFDSIPPGPPKSIFRDYHKNTSPPLLTQLQSPSSLRGLIVIHATNPSNTTLKHIPPSALVQKANLALAKLEASMDGVSLLDPKALF